MLFHKTIKEFILEVTSKNVDMKRDIQSVDSSDLSQQQESKRLRMTHTVLQIRGRELIFSGPMIANPIRIEIEWSVALKKCIDASPIIIETDDGYYILISILSNLAVPLS